MPPWTGLYCSITKKAGTGQAPGKCLRTLGASSRRMALQSMIPLTFCMAHARRKFVDAVKDDEKQANYVLDEIQKLYLLEAKMRDGAMGWQQRTALRKEHAEPVLENLGKWLEEKQYSYRPKSPMGQAIAYRSEERRVGKECRS